MRLRVGLLSLIAVLAVAAMALASPAALATTVATPSEGPIETACPNAQFRTGLSANLPDCRAYEQVTPVEKGGGGNLFSGELPGEQATVSEDGNRVLLETFSKFPGVLNVNPFFPVYTFTRTGSGWNMASITPTGAAGADYNLGDFQTQLGGGGIWSTNFSTVATSVVPEVTKQGVGVSYQVGPFGGPYTTIATPTNTGTKAANEQDQFLAGTPDLSSILFSSTDHSLASGASGTVAGAHDLYDYTGGQLHLVNVTSGGSLVSACGANIEPAHYVTSPLATLKHAISSDGSKIFFESPDPEATADGASDPSCSQPPQLYMRDTATGTTVEVSAPQGITDPNGPQPVAYIGASADGSKVFFASTGELTPDDAGIHDEELYEYDTLTGKLTRISHGASGTAAANVSLTAAVASDGSAVYFESRAQLTPDAQSISSCTGGHPCANLYRYNTTTGTTTYIATADAGEVGPPYNTTDPYTTPDGRFLLFQSAGLVGGPAAAGVEGQQVYRYDSSDGSLTCVSCRPNGTSSGGYGMVIDSTNILANPSAEAQRPLNPISTTGRYVFFASNDKLVPQDTNGVGNCERSGPCEPGENTSPNGQEPWTDVYEWEADGTGGCAASGGCVHLLTSGTSQFASELLGASADGSNVFIDTQSPLVSQDSDTLGDIYDVRINGGLPSPSPATCTGDGCQGPLTQAPALSVPTSVSFSGPGNLAASRSAKHHGKHKEQARRRRHQKLRRALKRCARIHRHNRHKRLACKLRARRRLGAHAARRSKRPARHRRPQAAR